MNAAAATQQMLDVFDISGIVHFGIAGNANNSMSIGDVIIPKQFIHTGLWDWMVSFILKFHTLKMLTFFEIIKDTYIHVLSPNHLVCDRNQKQAFILLISRNWTLESTMNQKGMGKIC